MKRLFTATRVFLSLSFFCVCSAHAAAPPSSKGHHEAGMSKTGQYASSGVFLGGNRTVTSARLKDIRRGPQKGGVERIVFDLQGPNVEKDQTPYFQVNINPDESRVLVSIWADVTYDFDASKIKKAFSKSQRVKQVNVVPRVEDGMATIELILRQSVVKVEAFHLAHPTRIILDLL